MSDPTLSKSREFPPYRFPAFHGYKKPYQDGDGAFYYGFYTHVRIQVDGKYYLFAVRSEYNDIGDNYEIAVSSFIKEVWVFMHTDKAVLMRTVDDETLFGRLDPDQTPEEERLKKLLEA